MARIYHQHTLAFVSTHRRPDQISRDMDKIINAHRCSVYNERTMEKVDHDTACYQLPPDAERQLHTLRLEAQAAEHDSIHKAQQRIQARIAARRERTRVDLKNLTPA